MKRLFIWALSLLLAAVPASAQMMSTGIGGGGFGSVAGYQGPLDIIGTNVNACYSLRACSAALRGTKIADVCNTTGGVEVACADLLSDGTTGALVPATIGGITCPGSNCTVRVWYDQTAGNKCGGTTCDMGRTSSTVTERPFLVASGLGSLPIIRSDGVTQRLYANTSLGANGNQPASLSSIVKRTAGTALGTTFGDAAATGLFFNGSGVAALFGGSNAVDFGGGAITENQFHIVNGVLNGASSIGFYDGTPVNPLSTTPGSSGLTAPSMNSVGFFVTNLEMVEGVIWAGNKAASFSALCTNQYGYWGTFVSC